MASVVSPIMPPMMPVPIEWRAFAPAPEAIASGKTPSEVKEGDPEALRITYFVMGTEEADADRIKKTVTQVD